MDRYLKLVQCGKFIERKTYLFFKHNANKLSLKADSTRQDMFYISSVCSWAHNRECHQEEDGEVRVREQLLSQTKEDFERLLQEKKDDGHGYKVSCSKCQLYLLNFV